MVLDELLHDREPEPGARIIGSLAPEGLEYRLPIRLSDALSVIEDLSIGRTNSTRIGPSAIRSNS
jgi:hypothetical protein